MKTADSKPPIVQWSRRPSLLKEFACIGVVIPEGQDIARVDFYGHDKAGEPLPGGVMMASRPSFNHQNSMALEWFVEFDTKRFVDGPFEVRAEVFSKSGAQTTISKTFRVSRLTWM